MKGRDGLEASDDWGTPKWLYNILNHHFKFDFDPCPLHHDMSWDGLEVEWQNSNFVNPPYNRVDKPKFIEKAWKEYKKGKTVVMLIPAATGTAQFHKYILPGAHVTSFYDWDGKAREKTILFMRGRIAFDGEKKGKGKHDSMIVIWQKQ